MKSNFLQRYSKPLKAVLCTLYSTAPLSMPFESHVYLKADRNLIIEIGQWNEILAI